MTSEKVLCWEWPQAELMRSSLSCGFHEAEQGSLHVDAMDAESRPSHSIVHLQGRMAGRMLHQSATWGW